MDLDAVQALWKNRNVSLPLVDSFLLALYRQHRLKDFDDSYLPLGSEKDIQPMMEEDEMAMAEPGKPKEEAQGAEHNVPEGEAAV